MKAFENWLHFTKWENDLKSIFIRVIREIRDKTRFQPKDAKSTPSKIGLKGWAGSPLHAAVKHQNLSIAGIPYQPRERNLLPLLW